MTDRLRAARGEEGFSLIELLIVIVILGVLAGIVVFGVGTFRSDSAAAACEADAKSHSVAAAAWKAKHGTAPAMSDLTGGASPYLEDTPSCVYNSTGTAVAYTP